MKLIDVHAHVQASEFDADREEVIQRSLDAGIGMIVVGTTITDSLAAIRLAQHHATDPVYAAVGVHPTDEDIEGIHPAQLHALVGDKKVVAIGECGLDYYRLDPDDTETRQLQQDVFDQHILLAAQSHLPLIIHCRDRDNVYDAYEDVLVALARQQFTNFVMHCYSGTWEIAERFLERGGYLSFTGIVTFPKSETMQEVATKTPADKIMIETDAPFLAPVPHRGQRNEPAYVADTAAAIAKLRGTSIDDFSAQVVKNAQRFFELS